MKSTLGFYGGVGSVTGANFMLDTGETVILVDCGLVQGDKFAMNKNAETFVYDPKRHEKTPHLRGVLSREPPRMLLEVLGGYHFQVVSEISCEFS